MVLMEECTSAEVWSADDFITDLEEHREVVGEKEKT